MSIDGIKPVEMPIFGDGRGSLGVAQTGSAVPFAIQRLFYLFDIAPGATRGHHAHREQHQFLIMMSGGARIVADDGGRRGEWTLGSPRQGLYVPPMNWLELTDFTPGAVCAVLTSGGYDEADYVRDYAVFVQLAGQAR